MYSVGDRQDTRCDKRSTVSATLASTPARKFLLFTSLGGGRISERTGGWTREHQISQSVVWPKVGSGATMTGCGNRIVHTRQSPHGFLFEFIFISIFHSNGERSNSGMEWKSSNNGIRVESRSRTELGRKQRVTVTELIVKGSSIHMPPRPSDFTYCSIISAPRQKCRLS